MGVKEPELSGGQGREMSFDYKVPLYEHLKTPNYVKPSAWMSVPALNVESIRWRA